MAERREVIGIYGLPGCGKSFILNRLDGLVYKGSLTLVEGSSKIASLCGEEGLRGFKLLDEGAKYQIRERAIQAIGKEANDNGRDAIVTGHYSFWEEGEPEPLKVWTDADASTYTNIIYLRVDPAKIHERRRTDAVTIRPQVSVEHLQKWQDAEVQSLRRLCAQSGILFTELKEQLHLAERVYKICARHGLLSERMNSHHVDKCLEGLLRQTPGGLSTVLLVDGDRTLSPEDTGRLFWTAEPPLGDFGAEGTPTERLFRDHGYSLFAFQQAAIVYEEALDGPSFQARCRQVAQGVKLYPELEALVRTASMQKDVFVIVVTSGIVRIWDAIIENLALPESSRIAVLGGAGWPWFWPVAVTPEVKGQVASYLREVRGLHVLALGDSPIDIPMLQAAHHAIVVVGAEESRSRSMEDALSKALAEGLQAKQLLLPPDVPPRLDLQRLPRVTAEDIMADLQQRGARTLGFLHATDKEACRLLASPTRDPSVSGPDLKRATSRIGQYLALEYLGAALGLAQTPSRTVQGTPTVSHSLRDEHATAIVAIMRAGEPLAEGIFEVFPRARFIHAKDPADLTARELEGIRAVLLVDTVINTGKTIIEFVEHVRGLDLGLGPRNGHTNGDGNGDGNGEGHSNGEGQGVRIVVVASVVQAQTVQEGHPMSKALVEAGATLVALRVSENKYKGTKGLDTGNRMFNTTHKD